MVSLTEQDRQGGKVKFVANHQPALAAGQYTITVEQKVQINGAERVDETFSAKKQNFIVQAPRFALNPQQIQAVFPPEGSLGDHADVLPHVILTPSTLPWEWSGANPKEAETPWLALLVFYDDELPRLNTNGQQENVKAISAGELGIQLEEGQHADDPVSVIDVSAGLLKQIMPTKAELGWLTHVRQATDDAGKIQDHEVAVVMANRLPQAGGISVVHLVAVEQRYSGENFLPKNAKDGDLIRLVSLKSWRFACLDENQSFSALLKKLDQSAYRLADVSNDEADRLLKQGNIPLPHAMRQGNKTVSWYRSPLIPGHNNTATDVSLPVRTADALVHYNPTLSMFDASYAAAWELGRLLMLRAKNVSLDLYHWKRSHAQKLKDTKRQIAHLPFDGPPADPDLPPSVRSWFERTALLQGVPFHYLVADERLLPRESIRFFQVDWQWVECMLDGAYSIGRVLTTDHKRERSSLPRDQITLPHRQMSGFLLRSEVVAGWPDLLVDGYDRGYSENKVEAETKHLFTFKDAALAQQLNEKRLADIRQTFEAKGVTFSSNIAIDRRCWIIRDTKPKQAVLYELAQVGNNQIDVRQVGQTKIYHFTLDTSFEPDLNAGQISDRLRKAFRSQKLNLPEDASIMVTRWFIADQDQQTYYIVELDDDDFNVYRDFKLPLLRMERLSNSVLICLFEGIVHTVNIHQKPEAIHHGVDRRAKRSTHFKRLRDAAGHQQRKPTVRIPLTDDDKRVIDVNRLARRIRTAIFKQQDNLGFQQPFTAAQFALQMVEDVPKVRFVLD